MFKHMALLFFLTSCALFRGQPSLDSIDKEKLLDSVKITGEGKGRLTLEQSSYVFGVDSVLNEDKDWILAVEIPLHGEEVMILPDLKQAKISDEETESFELRIEREFKRIGIHRKLSSEKFLSEMRSLVRFVLAKELGKKPVCVAQKEVAECSFDDEKFQLRTESDKFFIEKKLDNEFVLQLVAKNLTKSFFEQTDILLLSKSDESLKKPSSFSMEFFW